MEGQAKEVAWRMSWRPGRCGVLSVGRVTDSSKSEACELGEGARQQHSPWACPVLSALRPTGRHWPSRPRQLGLEELAVL